MSIAAAAARGAARAGGGARVSARGCALGGGGVLPSSGSGAARGGAGRCGLSGRPAAAAACLQRAAGRALINALVNGKRCRARLPRAPGVPGSPPPPGWVGRNLAEGSDLWLAAGARWDAASP